jgi:hypothetical protein
MGKTPQTISALHFGWTIPGGPQRGMLVTARIASTPVRIQTSCQNHRAGRWLANRADMVGGSDRPLPASFPGAGGYTYPSGLGNHRRVWRSKHKSLRLPERFINGPCSLRPNKLMPASGSAVWLKPVTKRKNPSERCGPFRRSHHVCLFTVRGTLGDERPHSRCRCPTVS